jgi:hypothetical protein
MKKLLIPCLFFIAISSAPSCSKPSESRTTTSTAFFDVSGFFQSEIERLNQLQPTVEKTFMVNQITETIPSKTLNYHLELSPFIECDINKKAWEDKYSIVESDASLTYKTLDEQLEIREITIQKDSSNHPSHIQIIKISESPLSYNKTMLKYHRNQEIEIVSTQKNILSEEKEISTKIQF